MWKSLLGYAMDFIGGSSVQIYIYLALAIGGFGAGFYLEHLRFANYQIEVENMAKAAEAKNKAVEQQHKLVTQGIQDEYDAKLSLLRQYYSNGVRQPSSNTMPNISTATAISNANTAYAELAANCAQTTLMLVELQKWINEQIGISNER
jgi:hypothetical protein